MTSAQIGVVLVCRSDIDPPLLVSHIPHLVAACNGAPSTIDRRVKLVTLPKGAEDTLSEAFGLRRVAVIALNVSYSISIRRFTQFYICSLERILKRYTTGFFLVICSSR